MTSDLQDENSRPGCAGCAAPYSDVSYRPDQQVKDAHRMCGIEGLHGMYDTFVGCEDSCRHARQTGT